MGDRAVAVGAEPVALDWRGLTVVAIKPPRFYEDRGAVEHLLSYPPRHARVRRARANEDARLVRAQAEPAVGLGILAPLVLTIVDGDGLAVGAEHVVSVQLSGRALKIEIGFESKQIHLDPRQPFGIEPAAQATVDPSFEVEVAVFKLR